MLLDFINIQLSAFKLMQLRKKTYLSKALKGFVPHFYKTRDTSAPPINSSNVFNSNKIP